MAFAGRWGTYIVIVPNGREYTYFGAAFYRDSLIDADFRAAFDRAVPLVRAWEKEQDFKHSRPRIWVGREIAARLPHAWNPSGPSTAGGQISSRFRRGGS